MDPIAVVIGTRLAADRASSALPGAPVRPTQPPRLRRRARLATALRRAADRLEPPAASRMPVAGERC